jgi:hypothetical protein
MNAFERFFIRLYQLDLKVREYLPSPVQELLGGLLLSIAAGSFARATAISAGYEALVDQNNVTAKAGFLDFAERQLAIVVWFFIVK